MDRRVGVLGGGQLGRMLIEAANRLNIQTSVLDASNAPATQVNGGNVANVAGSFKSADDIRTLAARSDVVTIEIEHVNAEVLAEIERTGIADIQPSTATIALIQDKFQQKLHWLQNSLPTAECLQIGSDNSGSIDKNNNTTFESSASTADGVAAAAAQLGYPLLLKSRRQAYDGRGNFVVNDATDIPAALSALNAEHQALYAEKFVEFECELAVMVVRTRSGETLSFPCVETVQRDNICHLVFAPARVPQDVRQRACGVAARAVKTLSGAGVFGVELFLLKSGEILINEVAPRPHNSGHYTIEACRISQFEVHLRAILGLQISKEHVQMLTDDTQAVMVNILGGESPKSHQLFCSRALEIPGCFIHMYGKGDSRPNRKMGHVTIVRRKMSDCEAAVSRLIDEDIKQVQSLEKSGDELTIGAAVQRHRLTDSLQQPNTSPQVAIIMGSDSDMSVMSAAADILDEFGVSYDFTIVSAHRTPERMFSYARSAHERGFKVIIAGAGGAAHLPGMVAALTNLPVIGVPVSGKKLDGVDSLYSIVQMPRGVPVATVAINNAMNAGILAARIIGCANESLYESLMQYSSTMETGVLQKAEILESLGRKDYSKFMQQ